jgi:L-2,4-diaminobutyric acid acetyltransferase
LDTNSVYCNLLQCTHFAATSVAAWQAHALVGFVSGYLPPGRPDTLFIWQVAVDESARGKGLASRMLTEILQRPDCDDVRWLETSITRANSASWGLFEGFAAKHGVRACKKVLFDRDEHFLGEHATEYLLRIGPLRQPLAENAPHGAETNMPGSMLREATP